MPFFLYLYRSPSQVQEKFEMFFTDFNLSLSNSYDISPAYSIITGDCNARIKEWWKLDEKKFKELEINSCG